MAAKQGWRISPDMENQFKIERVNNILPFGMDATYHVLQNAKSDKLCRDAIRIVYQI